MKIGEIVVRRWSKATTLKRKVFKIISSEQRIPNGTLAYEVIDPYGKKHLISTWQLATIDTLLQSYLLNITLAENCTLDRRKILHRFEKEVASVNSFFPKV